MLDDIIHDEDKIHQTTLADGPKFQYILERAETFLEHSDQMPLFRDNDRRISDPGNRCNLYLRHALLMTPIHRNDNPTRGALAAFFGIDQTMVSRYLPVMDSMLETLPTATKISEEITSAETQEDLKKIVPGFDGGDIYVDGAHCPVQRPSEKSLRRMKYSEKFTNNTNVYTNRDGTIIEISKSVVGSVGVFLLLREYPMPFGKWEEMHKQDRSEEEKNRIVYDRGYQGIAKDLPGTVSVIPYTKSKNHSLTREQKRHNSRINSERIPIEHFIDRLKRYARISDPCDGMVAAQFDREFNVIIWLVNLHLLWDHMCEMTPPGQQQTSVDWERARSEAPVK